METVGSGKTHVLRGMAVVTAGKIVGFQEGIISSNFKANTSSFNDIYLLRPAAASIFSAPQSRL